jgi:hypothetical protein
LSTWERLHQVRLPGKAAGQGCRARLPGKAAGQGCRARLPGKAARQGCTARLHGKAARQGCTARLDGVEEDDFVCIMCTSLLVLFISIIIVCLFVYLAETVN